MTLWCEFRRNSPKDAIVFNFEIGSIDAVNSTIVGATNTLVNMTHATVARILDVCYMVCYNRVQIVSPPGACARLTVLFIAPLTNPISLWHCFNHIRSETIAHTVATAAYFLSLEEEK
jgi:hypothetical protein